MTAESLVRPQEAAPSAAQVREQVREQLRQQLEQVRLSQEMTQAAREEARAAAQEARAAGQEARAAGQASLPPIPPPQTIRIGRDGRVVVTDQGATGQAIHVDPNGTVTGPPVEMVENIAQSFFVMVAVIALGVPLLRLIGRWMDRRHAAPAALPADFAQRLERIEQAVDTIAIEVERISEGQRFTSKLLAEMGSRPQLVAAERIAEPRS